MLRNKLDIHAKLGMDREHQWIQTCLALLSLLSSDPTEASLLLDEGDLKEFSQSIMASVDEVARELKDGMCTSLHM